MLTTEAPRIWSSDVKNWLIGKVLDAGNDWRQEKRMTEDEIVGWYHWLKGCKFEQAPWVANGRGSLVCYRPWGHKESDMTEWLNWSHIQKSTNSDPDKFNFPQIFTECQYVPGTSLDSGDSTVNEGPKGVYILIRTDRLQNHMNHMNLIPESDCVWRYIF